MSSELGEVVAAALALPRWTEPCLPLEVGFHEVGGEPIGYRDAVSRRFLPAPPGQRWGRPWDTAWFRLIGAVPAAWAGGRVVARLDLGWPDEHPGFSLEALVWRDGEPIRGLCRFHEEVVLSRAATAGETVELYVEAAANPGAFPGAPTGVQLDAEPLGQLRRAELVRVDAGQRRVRRLLELAQEALTAAAGERAHLLEQCLRRACELLTAGAPASEVAAVLAPVLSSSTTSGRTGPRLHAVANSHLDTAWLWPTRETRRKAARTLSTALEIAADHPGHVFAFSQPQQLAWVERDYPSLFQRVQSAVASGEIELVGASWVEPDTNVPSGESLVRQLTVGARYLRERFGGEVGGLWLPDVFGYSGQLPQLMRLAGLTWLMTAKLGMNDTNRFPHRSFTWEGIDGSRVLVHLPPADTYNGVTTLEQVRSAAAAVSEDTAGHALYLYGYGDGGGGPTREMVERVALLEQAPEAPPIARGSAQGFFAALARDARELPVWVGELYFELHRGTYTTQAQTKQWHRRSEEALREAELWLALAGMSASGDLGELWECLLLQEFHDILPGSSIGWVHADAVTEMQELVARADALGGNALTLLAPPAAGARVVVNTVARPRAEVTVLDAGPAWVSSPGMGLAPLGEEELPASVAPVTVDGTSMSNGLVRIAWDPGTGHLVSLRDLVADREVLAGPGNLLTLHDDRPRFWDAWDIERRDVDAPVPLDEADKVELAEATPLRAVVQVRRRAGASSYVQTVALHAGSPLLHCRVEVDWHERHHLLKVGFPVAVRAAQASYEIQFGHLQRPTHRNTSWDAARFEVCAQRWADLSGGGYGVALLNKDRNGYDVHGSLLRLSLLRAPTWPDPEADQGWHGFDYAVYPHAGDLVAADVPGVASCYQRPMQVRAGLVREPVVVARSSDPGVVVETVKPADDGDGLIVRLFEAYGGHRGATVSLPAWQVSSAEVVDLHERPSGTSSELDAGAVRVELAPFQVLTLRVRARRSLAVVARRGGDDA